MTQSTGASGDHGEGGSEAEVDSEAMMMKMMMMQQQGTKASAKSSVDANAKSKPKVRFAASTKTATKTARGQPQRQKNPAKVGKASPIRDLAIFVCFMGFVVYVALVNENMGDTQELIEKPAPTTLEEMRASMSKMMSEAMKSKKVTKDCDLFLTPSSIPGAGIGVFAGKSYAKGEVVMRTGSSVLPLEADSGTIYYNPIAGVLRHHPELANIETESLWFDDLNEAGPRELVASRDIQPGDELFVPFSTHPHSKATQGTQGLFDDIPLVTDYEMADAIIQDCRHRLKARSYSTPKKNFVAIGGALLLARAVARQFNPKVAELLPIMAEELLQYSNGEKSVTRAMRPKGYDRITIHGKCFDGSFLPEASTDDFMVAKRKVSKDEVIHHAPAVLVDREAYTANGDGQDDCPATVVQHCIQSAQSSQLICPLTSGAFEFTPIEAETHDIENDVDNDVENEDDSAAQSDEQETDQPVSHVNGMSKHNAIVRWGTETLKEGSLLKGTSMAENNGAGQAKRDYTSVQFVATRDIMPNEKIIVMENPMMLQQLLENKG